jgi:predicted nucleic acid-binding protein
LRVLFDTDVVLDLLLDRLPHSSVTARLFSKVEFGEIFGYLCATTVTTIHYLALKALGSARSRKEMKKLLSLFDVAPVNRVVLEGALGSRFKDFEDAVVHEAAHQVSAHAIVTRNIRDFKRSTIPVYSPGEFEKMIRSHAD